MGEHGTARQQDEEAAAFTTRAIRETAAEMRVKYQGDTWRLAMIDALEKMSLAVVEAAQRRDS